MGSFIVCWKYTTQQMHPQHKCNYPIVIWQYLKASNASQRLTIYTHRWNVCSSKFNQRRKYKIISISFMKILHDWIDVARSEMIWTRCSEGLLRRSHSWVIWLSQWLPRTLHWRIIGRDCSKTMRSKSNIANPDYIITIFYKHLPTHT